MTGREGVTGREGMARGKEWLEKKGCREGVTEREGLAVEKG